MYDITTNNELHLGSNISVSAGIEAGKSDIKPKNKLFGAQRRKRRKECKLIFLSTDTVEQEIRKGEVWLNTVLYWREILHSAGQLNSIN